VATNHCQGVSHFDGCRKCGGADDAAHGRHEAEVPLLWGGQIDDVHGEGAAYAFFQLGAVCCVVSSDPPQHRGHDEQQCSCDAQDC
jgi:hypothetical protein